MHVHGHAHGTDHEHVNDHSHAQCRDGGVEVIVAVDLIGPVIVAVHVHGNDTVIVI